MPATFRFVHASDLHLDAPPLDLHRAPTAVMDAVCGAPLAAWESLVRLTIEQDAAFLLLAGDVCDGGERAVAAQRRLLRGLQQLSDHNIRTFIVRGPADPGERWAGISAWPDRVHCFDATPSSSLAVTRGDERIATIHGFTAGEPDSVREAIKACGIEPDPGLHVGLLHANVTVEPGDGKHLSVRDLQSSGVGYWALGHDHRRRHLTSGAPVIVYPGTLQGRGFREGETGAKGAELIQVRDGAVIEATFHPLDTVRTVMIDAEVRPSFAETCRVLREQANTLRASHAGRDLVVRAVLHGQRPASPEWGLDSRARLMDHLRRDAPGERPFVWWDGVLDCATPTAAPGPLGTFVAEADGCGVFGDDPHLDDAQRNSLLTAARQRALDLLSANAR